MAWNNYGGNGRYGNYPNRSYNNNGYNGNYGGGGRWNGNYQDNGYNGRYSQQGKQPKYTKSEKMAYNSGMGYALAIKGKGINFEKPNMKESFNSGYKFGIKLAQKNPQKYFDKSKSKRK